MRITGLGRLKRAVCPQPVLRFSSKDMEGSGDHGLSYDVVYICQYTNDLRVFLGLVQRSIAEISCILLAFVDV
jgi:hypothetical protein